MRIADDLFRYEGKRSKKLSVKLRYFFFTPGFTFTFSSEKHLAQNSSSIKYFGQYVFISQNL